MRGTILGKAADHAIHRNGRAFALVLSGVTGVHSVSDTKEAQVSSDVATVFQANDQLSEAVVAPASRDADSAGVVHQKTEAVLDLDDGGRALMQHVDKPDEMIGLGLDGADDLESVVLDPVSGIAAYASPEEEFTYVPVLRDDGTVQAHTVIDTPGAPTRFEYTVDIPEGGHLEMVGTSVLILDAQGDMVGGIAPAWAKDAVGNDVPTHYEIDGATLTRVVEHDSSFAYPVTADPWLRINLFGHVYKDTYRDHPRVNASLSAWGWSVYSGASVGGPAKGQQILNTSGLSEVLSRGQDIRDAFYGKASMYAQYACHALGAVAAGQWNLERIRPNLTVPWTTNLANHRCNWNYSNGGV